MVDEKDKLKDKEKPKEESEEDNYSGPFKRY